MAKSMIAERAEKTIGVEIEFFGVDYRTVVANLQRAGLEVEYKGYTHQVMGGWKLVTDVSVTSTGTGLGRGLELVSPPLKQSEMERQLKIALTTLARIGAKVDKTCGVHVHHAADDLTVQGFKNLYRFYNKYTSEIDSFMANSRRRDTQKAMKANGRPAYCKGISDELMGQVERARSISEMQSLLSDRYFVLNFTSYIKYGTIEFRQHGGSVEFEKVWNWVLITQSMVSYAAKKKEVPAELMASILDGRKSAWYTMKTEIGLHGTELGEYLNERRTKLA